MSEKREIIVNENDEIIGYKYWYDKDENDIYRVSSLWIVVPDQKSYKVLIAQRKWAKKNDPGKWGPSVAGTVEEGESYEDNIYKEAKEEVGLVSAKFLPMFDKPMFYNSNHRYFTMKYVTIGNWSLSDFTLQKSEVESLDLVNIDYLLHDTLENPDKYLLNFYQDIVDLKKFLEKMK